MENPVSLQSAFLLVDNWRLEIVVDNDGREFLIEVNKQPITLLPNRSEPVIVLERKGKQLSYALWNLRNPPADVSRIDLPMDAQAPSSVSIKLQGMPIRGLASGVFIRGIVVNGTVRPEE